MNFLAYVHVCPRADLIVMDFAPLPTCKQGHALVDSNIYIYMSSSGIVYKWCKRCRADRERRRQRRLKGKPL